MSSLFPLVLCLLLVSPLLAQQKCINYFCDGAQKADPSCQFGYKRTIDYGVTYKCVEELLKDKYSGCAQNGGSFMLIGDSSRIQPGFVRLTPYDTQYFTCYDETCYTETLITGTRFYCPEKNDRSCLLGRRVTADYGLSYNCLETYLSSKYDCAGKLQLCSWQACETDSIAYQSLAKPFSGEKSLSYYYCEGNGCGSGKMKKTGSTFVCADPACEYSAADAWPFRNYPLQWTLNSNKKWVCQDKLSSSECGDIQVKYSSYCAPKTKGCLSEVLVSCKECDENAHDCIEDYPGWCCEASKSNLAVIILFVSLFVLFVLSILWYDRQKKQKQLQRKLEGGYDYSMNVSSPHL